MAYVTVNTPIAARADRPRASWIARLIARYVRWRDDRRALAALRALSDHDLADVGLSRADLDRMV